MENYYAALCQPRIFSISWYILPTKDNYIYENAGIQQ